MIRFFLNFSDRETLIELYRKYCGTRVLMSAKNLAALGVLVQVALIGFDFLLFQDPLFYMQPRIILILGYFVSFVLIDLVSRMGKEEKAATAGMGLLFFQSIWLPAFYMYFLVFGPKDEGLIISAGYFLVVMFQTFFVHRFAVIQWSVSLVGILSSLALAALVPDLKNNFILLAITYVVAAGIAFFMRREFVSSLYDRYGNLKSILPQREAMMIALADEPNAIDKYFKQEIRFTVCLVSDWRNYQKLAGTTDPYLVSKYFEEFYETCFEKLREICPEGNYYANWTADELFIVFFGSEVGPVKMSPTMVVDRSIQFALALSQDVYETAKSKVGFNLEYDIGMACGKGLVGLQGPKGMKQTTVTSENAGIAKRLETICKSHRESLGEEVTHPLMLVDKDIYAIGTACDMLKSHSSKEVLLDLRESEPGPEKYFLLVKEKSKVTRINFRKNE